MLIEIKNASRTFTSASQEKRVLKGISAVLPETGLCIISGPSGCGKTTLLRLLAGLDKPDEGEIIRGKNDMHISVAFQEDRLLGWLTALDNVALVSERETAHYWLGELGLSDSIRKYPSQLSGGMCRRVSLARAFAAPADMLILDEPMRGLDSELALRVEQIIVKQALQKLVVVVVHSQDELKYACETLGQQKLILISL